MDATPLVHDLLVAHGLNVVPHNGWLTAAGRNCAITTTLYRNEAWHPSLIQLDVRVLTPSKRIPGWRPVGHGGHRRRRLPPGRKTLLSFTPLGAEPTP